MNWLGRYDNRFLTLLLADAIFALIGTFNTLTSPYFFRKEYIIGLFAFCIVVLPLVVVVTRTISIKKVGNMTRVGATWFKWYLNCLLFLGFILAFFWILGAIGSQLLEPGGQTAGYYDFVTWCAPAASLISITMLVLIWPSHQQVVARIRSLNQTLG